MAQPLFDKNISKTFASIIFSESHGAFDDHLGAGAMYYALATMIRSQVSVCIGSGGGFVPRLFSNLWRWSPGRRFDGPRHLRSRPERAQGLPEQTCGVTSPSELELQDAGKAAV